MTGFTQAMRAAGYSPPNNIVADGQIHRFHVEGDKPRSENGWFVLYGGEVSAGAFGSWKTGEKVIWRSVNAQQTTVQEKAQYRKRLRQIKRQRITEQTKIHRQAALDCQRIWNLALPVVNHPYLTTKRVRPYGLRLHGRALVVPLHNAAGELASLQFISPDGQKRFKAGGRIAGCFHLIGNQSGPLYICEGYATGATLYEQTGCGVVVAFNAGNLDAVTKAMRGSFPTQHLIVAADNDHSTEGNPGLTKGRAAAERIGAGFIYPEFIAGQSGTDFNDMMLLEAEL